MNSRPEILYKYRSWPEKCGRNRFQRRILTKNEIYFSSAEQFNDPFDNSLPFRYKESDLTHQNLYNKLFLIGRRNWPNMTDEQLQKICIERINSGAFENGNFWKENADRNIKSVKSSLGIFSLSAVNDSILMWSHYADSHRGYCIGFDSDILFRLSGSLGNVIYDNRFPVIGLFDDSLEGFVRFFITKSESWSYEQEYRILKTNFAKKTITFTNDCIKQIILGCKMKPSKKKEVRDIVVSKFMNAEIFEAEMNSTDFKIDIKRK
jgi:hypothetical protein